MVGLQDIHICSADQTYGAGRSMELQNVDYDIITAAELAYAHYVVVIFFFSSRRRHTRCSRDWSSDVCSSDLAIGNSFECFLDARIRKSISNLGLPRLNWEARLLDNSGGPEPSRKYQLTLLVEIGRASCRERV